MKLGAVLLAAGRSTRFGENKLLADLCGRPMVCCALEAAKATQALQIVVVTGHQEIAQLARACGAQVVINDAPELGQSHSIALGVRAVQELDAVLLMVCDQPKLSGASLKRLSQRFAASQQGIACLRDSTHLGNPAIFDRRYMDELLSLQGDRGAKGVLQAHKNDLLVVDTVGPDELADADTPQMLRAMRTSQ